MVTLSKTIDSGQEDVAMTVSRTVDSDFFMQAKQECTRGCSHDCVPDC